MSLQKKERSLDEIRELIAEVVNQKSDMTCLNQSVVRDLFDGHWDFDADCNRWSWACLELLKLLTNNNVDEMLGEHAGSIKRNASTMLTGLVKFFEVLRDQDVKGVLEYTYLDQDPDDRIAYRLEEEYIIKREAQKLTSNLKKAV